MIFRDLYNYDYEFRMNKNKYKLSVKMRGEVHGSCGVCQKPIKECSPYIFSAKEVHLNCIEWYNDITITEKDFVEEESSFVHPNWP